MNTSPRCLLLVALLVCGACGKTATQDDPTPDPEPIRALPAIGELFVGAITGDAPAPDGVEAYAKAAAKRAFRAPTRFREASEGQADACVANVGLGFILIKNGMPVKDADAGEARVVIEAELACPHVGGEAGEPKRDVFRVTTVDESPFGGEGHPPGAEVLRTLLDEQAKRAAMTLRGQSEMRGATDDAVVAALASSDQPGVLAEAASEAGERKLTAARERLIKLTAHAEGLVSVRAAAALGLLGEQDIDAVRALVDMTKGPSLERHFVAINALADIGGKDAARYLDAIANSHPELALRELARIAHRRAIGADESTESE